MSSKAFPRGSEWRKWDLHVHSPDSLVNTKYGAGSGDSWEQFLTDLEGLPSDFAVIGLNDYIFLDGYRKVLEARANGRLKNILTVFPVIELRLSAFAGLSGEMNKINYHVIFSDELSPDQIEAQFLSALRAKYKLEPGVNDGLWSGVIDRASLTDFGSKIIESSPEEVKATFPQPIVTGFNNLCLDRDAIEKILSGCSLFAGKYLTALGKTEWASMSWTPQSAATKKDHINKVDLIFSALEHPKDYEKNRAVLTKAKVNNRLFDCSDAHHLSTATQKDRIGNCATWIKADPTFKGLEHALREFDRRVFVGHSPENLGRVSSNPTKYIGRFTIKKKNDSNLSDPWFSTDIELNSALVAIVGNKGSGKSALVDCMALSGNSHASKNFSFLNSQRFCKSGRENLASHFDAELEWVSQSRRQVNLNTQADLNMVEHLKYVPQNFLEEVCNDPRGIEKFEEELKSVIFSHVPISDRLGQTSLDGLIAYKTEQIQKSIFTERAKIARLNNEIIDLERKIFPTHRKYLESLLQQKNEEIRAHDLAKPLELLKPNEESVDTTLMTELEQLRQKLLETSTLIEHRETTLNSVAIKMSICDRVTERILNLEEYLDEVRSETNDDLIQLGLENNVIFLFQKSLEPVELLRTTLISLRIVLETDLYGEEPPNLYMQTENLREQITSLEQKLSEPMALYQEYLDRFRDWQQSHQSLIGSSEVEDSLSYIQAQILSINLVPDQLRQLKAERVKSSVSIHKKLTEILKIYEQYFNPVKKFTEGHALVKDKIGLSFAVSLKNQDFEEQFFGLISKKKSGFFYGEAGTRNVSALIQEVEWNNEVEIVSFLTKIQNAITDNDEYIADPSTLLKGGHGLASLYDFIFGLNYLTPQYKLRLGDKDLEQLSPGERGLLLLVFYLLIDQADIPLLIDQPEENLDNQTIYETLVPAILEAKLRRQLILVTHNPNLAVVCDAEQVVYAQLIKTPDLRISYQSGSLEAPSMNAKVVDVLEGTRPAFNNRDSKYHKTAQ